METFKKVLLWLKCYWYVPLLLVVGIILFILFGKDNAVWRLLKETQESYRRHLEELRALQEENNKKKEELIKKYNSVIEQLEKKYQEDKRKIDETEKVQIKNYIENYSDDELAKKLSSEFGLEYIK